jgi:hypothetical protein
VTQLQTRIFFKYFRSLEINYEKNMANSKLITDQQAALISISSQGNLLWGIDTWPAATYKTQKGSFDNKLFH